jgi:hypothetical protein
VLDQLDGQLIGLAPVKTRIRGIAALLVVDRLRREHGHASERPSLHICSHRQPRQGKDYGGPGDVAEILHRIGYVEQGI